MKTDSEPLRTGERYEDTEDSPRRRILDRGGASLTDEELLAVLLSRDGDHRGAKALARDLLHERRGLLGLAGLMDRPTRAVSALEGNQYARLLASFELARRVSQAEIPVRDPMTRPESVARYLNCRYAILGQEVMGALFLDSRNRLIRESEIYRGTLSRAAVEPRGVLKEGLICDAAGFVLFHTHPSGDPSPSAEDLAFTRRLARSGELIGVQLVDHLILGDGASWISLRQREGW